MRQIVHISDSKKDVIEHLKKQINISGYIVKLIQDDMENKSLTKEEVVNLIEKYIEKHKKYPS